MSDMRKGTAAAENVMRCRYCNVDLRERMHSENCPTFEDARDVTLDELEAAAAIIVEMQIRQAREDGDD